MRITIELPDAMAIEAESLARAMGMTLSGLVASGLRRELAERMPTQAPAFAFHTMAGQGLLADLEPGQKILNSYELPALP